MAGTKDKMPEVVFIGPDKRKVKFRQVVFLVNDKDRNGIPTRLRMLADDESIKVEEGTEFMTGYIPAHMVEKK